MTDLATSGNSAARVAVPLQGYTRLRVTRRMLIALLVALILLAALCAPYFLWAYHTYQATRAVSIGLAWPEPRRSDTLPEQRDSIALATALDHLARAQHWQPASAHAYRLAGRVYAAQQNWINAATSYEQARARNPHNPLLAWESALIYEQMQRQLESSPRETLLSKLVSAPRESQTLPGGSDSCWGERPNECFIGLDTWTKPFADVPEGTPATYDTLVMHAPGGVPLTHAITVSHPTLAFLLGLDPRVGAGQSDGATYSISVEDMDGVTRIYERTLDRATALQGWVPDTVDVSPWAGRTITLIFRIDGGPAGHTLDDWYGWGNVVLTTPEAGAVAVVAPAVRWRLATEHAAIQPDRFVALGDEALQQRDFVGAANWYRRAEGFGAQPAAVRFRHAAALAHAGRPVPVQLHDAIQTHDGTFTTYTLRERLQLNGSDFRWLYSEADHAVEAGAPLSPSSGLGIMWWSGAATVLLDVEHDGLYTVRLQAQHTAPGPVDLSLELDGRPLLPVVLDRSDDSWQTTETTVWIKRGMHGLTLHYLNDGAVNGQDRNAVIGFVEVTRG